MPLLEKQCVNTCFCCIPLIPAGYTMAILTIIVILSDVFIVSVFWKHWVLVIFLLLQVLAIIITSLVILAIRYDAAIYIKLYTVLYLLCMFVDLCVLLLLLMVDVEHLHVAYLPHKQDKSKEELNRLRIVFSVYFGIRLALRLYFNFIFYNLYVFINKKTVTS